MEGAQLLPFHSAGGGVYVAEEQLKAATYVIARPCGLPHRAIDESLEKQISSGFQGKGASAPAS